MFSVAPCICIIELHLTVEILIRTVVRVRQVAELSQRDRAMLCVTEYFAKTLKVIRNDTLEKGISPY